MNELYEAISDVEKDLVRSKDHRRKTRKRVAAGVAHEGHLEYANGFVAGIESALFAMQLRRKDRIPEGDCWDIPG